MCLVAENRVSMQWGLSKDQYNKGVGYGCTARAAHRRPKLSSRKFALAHAKVALSEQILMAYRAYGPSPPGPV
jgi:hypothetical protein